MKVSDAMTTNVRIVNPEEPLQAAAQMMAELDSGVLPVGDANRLVGVITDRDIAIRGVAKGKGPKAKVRDVMSQEVKYCFEDEELAHVSQNMADIQVRRLPVVNREKRLVGIISLGDIATSRADELAGRALSGISRKGGEHTQSA